jgi:O-acetyl-ADP-ribose deacetylase (regulator of RNase III)
MFHSLISQDIFTMKTDAIVNPVNCVGVMGAGLARQFRLKYPEMFREYAKACMNNTLRPGIMYVFITSTKQTPNFIINFPTKLHWKDPSDVSYITKGLIALREEIVSREIHSIAIPKLGCGYGGLDWNVVRREIIRHLKDACNHVYLLE